MGKRVFIFLLAVFWSSCFGGYGLSAKSEQGRVDIQAETLPSIYSSDGELLLEDLRGQVDEDDISKESWKAFEERYLISLMLSGVFEEFDLIKGEMSEAKTDRDYARDLLKIEKVFHRVHASAMSAVVDSYDESFVRDQLLIGAAVTVGFVAHFGPAIFGAIVATPVAQKIVSKFRKKQPEALRSEPKKEEKNTFSSLLTSGLYLMAVNFAGQTFTKVIEKRKFKKLVTGPNHFQIAGQFHLVKELKGYLAYRHFFSSDIVKKMDQRFMDSWSYFVRPVGDLDPSTQLKESLNIVKNLPVRRQTVRFDEKDIRLKLNRHKLSLKNQLVEYAFSEFAQNRILMSGQRALGFSFPAYFVGSPGTGKTYAVKQLARSMRMPFSLVDLDGASVEKIEGTATTRGKLLDALSQRVSGERGPNVKSRILFIDEFDRLLTAGTDESRTLLAYILKLLDPAKRSFYSPYLGAEVALPDVIILAGNFGLDRVVDPSFEALGSRLNVINFEGFERDSIRAVIFEELIPEYLNKASKISSGRFSLNQLPDEDVQAIHHYIDRSDDRGLRSALKFAKKVADRALKKVYTASK